MEFKRSQFLGHVLHHIVQDRAIQSSAVAAKTVTLARRCFRSTDRGANGPSEQPPAFRKAVEGEAK